MICGVCAYDESVDVLSYDRYPAFLPPLPREVARDVVCAPLRLAACRRCGHFQVANVDPEVQRLLYEVYYRHYQMDTLETMIPAYREPFQRLVELVAPSRGRMLEIGCSAGAMTPFLARFCTEYVGVDPSERIELAREKFPQHTFVRAYFARDALDGGFDVAVSQFNLEHIERVGEFVAALASVVRQGGMLFVQVPDAGYYLRTRQPNFVAHEHVHYFRAPQLALLLGAHGFVVERWGDAGPSLMCAARRVDRSPQGFEVRDPLAGAEALRTLHATIPSVPARPVFYGVGLTLHWLLARFPSLADGATVIDDNLGYHGSYVPGYQLPIEAASSALLESRDVLLTLSAIYHDRVRARIASLAPTARVLLP